MLRINSPERNQEIIVPIIDLDRYTSSVCSKTVLKKHSTTRCFMATYWYGGGSDGNTMNHWVRITTNESK